MSAARGPAEIFEVESPYAGRLAVCMRPRGGMWLADDVRRLRSDGWDVLVSALQPGEVHQLHLGATARQCELHGVTFHSFPIGNLQVPAPEQAQSHFPRLLEHLQSGRSVAAHCFGSIGRGPLIVATLLVLGGVAPEEAWRRIREVRGEQVPDTYEQRDWVANLHTLDLGGVRA